MVIDYNPLRIVYSPRRGLQPHRNAPKPPQAGNAEREDSQRTETTEERKGVWGEGQKTQESNRDIPKENITNTKTPQKYFTKKYHGYPSGALIKDIERDQ